MKKGIIVDIDSTIWDINDMCIPAAEKLYPKIGPYSRDELTHWYALRDKYGKDFFNIYIEGLKPETIDDRQMYEGVDEALISLKEMDYIIHFITHNEAIPHEMEIYLEKWIHDSIPDLKFYLTVLNNQLSKIDFANKVKVYDLWGMIDDKPATLQEGVDKEVPFLATINTLYNQEVREENPQIQGFDSWDEVPQLVEERNGALVF